VALPAKPDILRRALKFYGHPSRFLVSDTALPKEIMMRRFLFAAVLPALLSAPVSAQNVDEIITKYIRTVGGIEKIQAVKTLRRSGVYNDGDGFETPVVQENKRPNLVREEQIVQGLTGVDAYDGRSGWKIEPWNGKKDAESMGEEELKEILEDSDFDGPLVNYREKGNKVEYVGTDQFEGTDVIKLKVTSPNGDVRIFYLDAESLVPIKIDTRRVVRGAERESETILGNYKQVAGWFVPFSIETAPRGSRVKATFTYTSIEPNVTIDDSRFRAPAPAKSAITTAPDASKTPPAPEQDKQPLKPAGGNKGESKPPAKPILKTD
jgi:outer membrane lipoprotein-sorting protein